MGKMKMLIINTLRLMEVSQDVAGCNWVFFYTKSKDKSF